MKSNEILRQLQELQSGIAAARAGHVDEWQGLVDLFMRCCHIARHGVAIELTVGPGVHFLENPCLARFA